MKTLLIGTAAALAAGAVFAAELPDGWYTVGDEGMKRYLLDVGAAHGYRDAGLRVRSQDDVAGSFGGVGQAIAADRYAGKTLRLTGYLRTDSVENGYAGLWFRVDQAKDTIAFDNMHDRGVVGTTDWMRYECVLHVGADATRILFGAILTGDGTMYADEFTLEVVPDSTPTTNAPGIAQEPKNLGF